MHVSLDGKIAIVTGAASGIGLATVLKFVEAGAAGIVAVDMVEASPEKTNAAISTGKVVYVAGDVGKGETAERFTQTALDKFGRIDVMVNNAGVSVVKPVHEHTSEEWDHIMETNVKAAFWAAKYVVPVMMRQKSGVILNTGSISGVAGIPMQGAYGPSKGAIHQMTRQMAIDYAPHGIRVNAVCCGTVDTPIVHKSAMASGDPEKFLKMLKDNHPIGRIATADEVAAFFTYMASDLASFFTGATIMMDGGYTAR